MQYKESQPVTTADMNELFARFLNLQTEAYRKMLAEQPIVHIGQNVSREAVRIQREGKDSVKNCGKIKFSKKEIQKMPQIYRHIFAYNSEIVSYRYHKGVYEARYRRNGFSIEVSSANFEIMKQKFIEKLNDHANGKPTKKQKINQNCRTADALTFSEYGEEWLKIKEKTTKPSTYKEYLRSFNVNLKPVFGHLHLTDIDRNMVQNFLFGFVDQGKGRTAEKLKLQLNCIFDMAVEDFNIQSPMRKIVLPHFESKKGSAFTKEEEKKLVEYCTARTDGATSSALLVLLYFGLRQSELKSIRIIDGKYLVCDTSKERMGKNVVERKIPFTPVFKRVLPYVDFDKARVTNPNAIASQVKRLFPHHHPHELRYTFITRCKEAGVNPEVVMLWDGHEQEAGVVTSRVDRGYTDYSEEYILSEAEKVNYKI